MTQQHRLQQTWCSCLPWGWKTLCLPVGCSMQHLIDAVTSDAFGDELPLGIISLDGESPTPMRMRACYLPGNPPPDSSRYGMAGTYIHISHTLTCSDAHASHVPFITA